MPLDRIARRQNAAHNVTAEVVRNLFRSGRERGRRDEVVHEASSIGVPAIRPGEHSIVCDLDVQSYALSISKHLGHDHPGANAIGEAQWDRERVTIVFTLTRNVFVGCESLHQRLDRRQELLDRFVEFPLEER